MGGVGEDALDGVGEREVGGEGLALFGDGAEGEARGEGVGGDVRGEAFEDAFALAEDAEPEVLRVERGGVEARGLVAGKEDDLAGVGGVVVEDVGGGVVEVVGLFGL